jgi:hypothetical protein
MRAGHPMTMNGFMVQVSGALKRWRASWLVSLEGGFRLLRRIYTHRVYGIADCV